MSSFPSRQNREAAFSSRILGAVLALFFFSGACGLVYEIIWTRLLRLVMGNTIFSITTVLCAFMGGLAAGSYLGGRFIERRRDPLRIYALLEAAVGLYCLALPMIINVAEPLYRLIYRDYASSYYLFGLLRFAFCGMLLLVPATFMGATLPVLSTFVTASLDRIGRSVGRLYAINTFGAVLGAAAAGFVLIPALGVRHTIALACLVNLLVATAAYLLHRRTPWPGAAEPAAGPNRERSSSGADSVMVKKPLIAWVLLAGYGLSGLAALTYEVAWTRVLSLTIGSSVYAFSLMLTAFILGLAVGSMALSRFVDRWRNTMAALAVTELLIGISALAVVPVFGWLPMHFGRVIAELSESFWKLQLLEFGVVFAVMLVPTVLMGLAFPLATRAYVSATSGISRSVGSLYAANTVGSILGSFLGGFVLIPLLGLQRTILVAVGINIVVGCAILLWSPLVSRGRRVAAAAVSAAMAVALAWTLPPWDPATLTFGLYVLSREVKGHRTMQEIQEESRNYRVLFHKEGIFDTITVRQEGKVRTLMVNGKPDASTGDDMTTQQLLGHVPMFLHRDPKNVLVIGLASGVTLGACSMYPVQQMDCAEISPDMPPATHFFDDVNHRVLEDPRLRLIIADGRNHLALTDRTYDVIISEPSNPWIAGIADLFTVEFFRLCRQRLNDDGLACIWVQGYGIDWRAFRSILSAFAEAFPYVTVWEAILPGDYLLVGSQRPIVADSQAIGRRLEDPRFRADLSPIGIASPAEFLSRFVLNEKALPRLRDDVPVHTDDNGIVEYTTPRTMFSEHSPIRIAVELNRLRGVGLEDLVARTGSPDQRQEMMAQLDRLMRTRMHLVNALVAAEAKHQHESLMEYRAVAELDPNQPMLNTVLSGMLWQARQDVSQRRTKAAVGMFQGILEIMPNHPEANYQLGLLLYSQGQIRQAIEYCTRAVEAKPDWVDAMNSLAWMLATSPDPALRNGAKALSLAERVNQLVSNNAEILDTLAAALAETGQFDRAVSTARQAEALARSSGQGGLVAQLEARIAVYQAKKPYHEK
ncbi:MAG: fused MFS/spermidine synthase [Phycisphaerae bacterium]|jgi:spermidine synthase